MPKRESNDLLTYEQLRTFTAELGGHTILIHSKPGMPNWDGVSPASRLLGEVAKPALDARALLIGCGHGALGVALARQVPAGEVLLFDINAIAVAMAQRTLAANATRNARVWPAISVLPERAASFELVVLETPNDRKLARRWLVETFHALVVGGELYLVDRNGDVFKKAERKERVDFPILTGVSAQEWKQKEPKSAELIRQALEQYEENGNVL